MSIRGPSKNFLLKLRQVVTLLVTLLKLQNPGLFFKKEIPRHIFGIVNGHTVPSICEECRVLWCIIAAGEILENNQTHIIVRVELLKSVMHKKSPRREYETRECV